MKATKILYYVLGDNPYCKAYTDFAFIVLRIPLKVAKKIQVASKTRDEMMGSHNG